MKVSLCMIVKDEEKHLPECLDSVEGMVDEIVIVDTGSTDKTPEIARERAHVFDERAWNGFADARNHSMDLATGDVILVLDADERVVDWTGWKDALKVLKEGSDGVAVLVENELPAHQLLRADRLWQVRLFMKSNYARWTGKVHNQITEYLKANPRDGKEAKFHQVDMTIKHLGYNLTPEEMKGKYEKRLDDLLDEVENAKTPAIKAYYQFQTSNSYFMLGVPPLSLKFAEECNLELLTHENAYSLCLMASHSCHALGKPEEADKWASKMLEIWPNEAMSFLMKGLALLGRNPKGAYNFLGATLSLCQLRRMGYKYILDQHYVAGAAGEAALQLKRYGEAKELFRMHLEKHENTRIAELEAAIVPIEDEIPQNGEAQDSQPQRDQKATETVQIPDLRKTG